MKEIKDVDEAIEFLSDKVGIDTEVVNYKYRVIDVEGDFNVPITTDKELIDYANEQKESMGEEE